jgi:hypothetical protein
MPLDLLESIEQDELNPVRSCTNCVNWFQSAQKPNVGFCTLSELVSKFGRNPNPDQCRWYETGNDEF